MILRFATWLLKLKARGRMLDFLQRSLRDRSAGVAMMFALTVIPLIGIIGIAIDFGLATQAKTQLNLATDAAALAAAKGAADAFTTGQQNYIAAGQTAGLEWFNSQAGTVLGTTLQPPSVTVTQTGPVFTSQVSYQGTVAPYFAPIFGVTTIALGGSSSATITTTAYVSVTFLLDNSSSMLIAATQAGVDTMNSITPISLDSNNPKGVKGPKGPKKRSDVPGFNPNDSYYDLSSKQCAFACHWDANQNDYYGLARQNNVQLRFDVLQNAAVAAVNQMVSQRKIADQFALTVYTFASGLTQIYPADMNQPNSTDLANGVTAVQNFQTPVVENDGNTNFPEAMRALAQQSTAAGDGSTTETRKKALIIVTDGLADYEPRTTPTSKGPINPADCAAMKSLGYNVYVLYTTYITTPKDLLLPFDNIDLLPYINGTASPKMVPSLQSCASAPTNYAEASDPAAINTAMTQMLQAALSNGGRYTQ